MDKLFQQRRQKHMQRMFRYLRLVFNDQFTIAFVFLIGGLGYWYAGFLQTLQYAWWEKFIAMFLMIGLLQFGNLATLLKPADKVFLLPQEINMERYLKAALRHSLWLSLLVQVVGVVCLLPFIEVAFQANFIETLWLIPTFIVFKVLILYDQMQSYYSHHNLLWLRLALPLLTFALFGVRLDMAWAFIFILIAAAARFGVRDKFWNGIFDWNEAIAIESGRQLNMLRFFNLFTDVPQIGGQTKRRVWLNFWFERLPKDSQHVYTNLYWRGLLRSSEYFGLIVRLTAIGALIAYFVHNEIVTPVILALILYLIGIQLLPLYHKYDEIVFTHLYPIDPKIRQNNFKQVMVKVLSVIGIILLLANLVGSAPWSTFFISLGIIIVEIVLFSYWLVPKRIARKELLK